MGSPSRRCSSSRCWVNDHLKKCRGNPIVRLAQVRFCTSLESGYHSHISFARASCNLISTFPPEAVMNVSVSHGAKLATLILFLAPLLLTLNARSEGPGDRAC